MSTEDYTQHSSDAVRDELLRRRLSGRGGRRLSGIGRADRTGPLVLSHGQQQMWFLNRLDPDSTEYLVPLAFRLRGRLDTTALQRAWWALLARHEILRTRYAMADGRPVQVIDGPVDVPLVPQDLTDLPADEREAHTAALVARYLDEPFQLEHDWPVRARLLRLAQDDHVLTVVFHHIACDAWSNRMFATELSALYTAFADGTDATLPSLAVQYADYAQWQRQEVSGAALERQLSYWRDQLTGVRPLDLPTDRPRPAVREHDGSEVTFPLPDGVAARVRDLAARHDTTPFVVFLTALQTLVSYYTGDNDVVVGTVASGRTRPELQNVFGYCINTLAMRATWDDSTSFGELVDKGRQSLIDAYDHQSVPFAQLVDELQPERDLSRTPLYQVAFTHHEAGREGFTLPGMDVTPYAASGSVAKCDLELRVGENADGSYETRLTYATALFDETTVRRMASHFVRLLDQATRDPDAAATAFDLLDTDELAVVLGESPIPVLGSSGRCLHEVFEERARQTPQAVAVVAGDVELSYGEVNERANRLAHVLRDAGVGAESLVGVCLERGADLVPSLLGVLKAGGGYVPLDPVNPVERLRYVLADAGASVLVTSAGLARTVEFAGRVVVLDGADADVIAQAPAGDLVPVSKASNTAYVIYTSGSTGRPKGVVVPHSNVVRLVGTAHEHFAFDASDVFSLFHSFAFDVSVFEMWGALLFGGSIVVVEREVTRSPEDFLDLLVERGVTVLSQTPSAFRSLVVAAGAGDERVDRLSLRAVVFAGEKLEMPELRPWAERLGLDRPALVNMYGITETTVHTTFHRVAQADLEPAGGNPVGRPLADLRVYLLDRLGRLVPVGVPGEIHVAGPGVARGYLNRPELTAERFLPDPFGGTGARSYRSGDLAVRRSDGSLDFLGRIDDQVKIRGFRIELGEIEVALAGQDGVGEAVVVTSDSASGNRSLVGYVVPQAGATVDVAAVRTGLGRLLPEYMVPSAVVVLDALPLTVNGKLDKRALPAPDEDAFAHAEFVAPRTPAEERIAAVWRDVLGVEKVGVQDSFFDLGGDSIRAVALVGDMRAQGIDVAVRDVFAQRTVAGLAELVGGREELDASAQRYVAPYELIDDETRALLPDGVVDAYPLTQIQAGMVVEMLADTGRNNYHNVSSFRIRDTGTFLPDAFRAAVERVVARHEVLRTSIHLTDLPVPLQMVHASAELPVAMADVSELAPEGREAALRAYIAGERAKPFDLGTPSLMRFGVHLTGDGGWWLSVTECHPILEGWSHHSLLMEVLTCYRQYADGTELDPYDLPEVRFADTVAAELASLASEEDRAYWQGVVGGGEKVSLPAGWGDEPTGPRTKHQVGIGWGDLEDGLRALATRAGASLKSVMMSAHVKVMSQLTDAETFHTGLVYDVRPEVLGADRVHGMYLNTLPFPADRTAGTWLELVRQVFAREVETWSHRRYPLPAIQRDSGGTQRLIDVFFNYQDFRQVDADLVDGTVGFDDSPTEFPLTISSRNQHVYLTADSWILSRANAERVADMYRAVLAAMARDADGDARATYLPEGERHALTGAWAANPGPLPWRTVREAFETQADATPDATAVSVDGTTISYAELDARANRYAQHLRSLGVGPEAVVAVLLDRGPELLAVLLGVWKAGGAYLPLDAVFPDERIGHMLADAGAVVTVTQETHAERVSEVSDRPTVLVDRDRHLVDASPAERPEAPAGPGALDTLAYMIYTSGSTGLSKGVLVTHGGLANHVEWAVGEFAARGNGGAPLFSSIAFDLVVPNLWVPLVVGQTVHLLPHDVDLGELGRHVAAAGPYSFIKLTPAHLDILNQQLTAEQAAALTSVLVVAGESLTRRVVQGWRDLAPDTPLINEYGPTEASVGTCVHPVEGPLHADVVPIGSPLPNVRMHVLDPHREPVPVGVPGELYVGGTGVARGYAGRPELTADKFVPDPFGEPGARLYRTGDLVRVLPGGVVDFIGRTDGQVKIRGYRVELGEIEAALTQLPEVDEARVLLREDTPGERQLVAYLVPVADGIPEPGTLRAVLSRTLPDYMVPYAFVAVDTMPLNANGKLDAPALPAPGTDAFAQVRHIAPRTPLEERVAAVWRDALPSAAAGVEDDFFEVGGDSIRAVALVGKLRADGFDIAVRDVFDRRTIAGVCELISGRGELEAGRTGGVAPFAMICDEDRARLPESVVDAYPLSLNQTGMLVETLVDGGQNNYHNVNVYRVHDDRPFVFSLFRQAVRAVTARHDVLRTSVHLNGFSEPMQLVHADADVSCTSQDLRDLDEQARDEALKAYVTAERMDPFDLSVAFPLLRVAAHIADDATWYCAFTQSHAVLDGWSNQLLLKDIVQTYRALRDGTDPAPHAAPLVRLADSVAAERAALASDEDRAYWRDIVADYAKTAVPVTWHGDLSAPAEVVHAVVDYRDLDGTLREAAAAARVSPKSVLVAAHVKVMSQLTDEPAFHTGLVTHSRPEAAGADQILGTFLNTLPFPAERPTGTWRELVRQVSDREIETWPHRHFPMPAIPREPGSGRLVDIFFSYLDFHRLDSVDAEEGAGLNDSPTEFGLSVSALGGLITLRSNTHVLSRANGERLVAMYRGVLAAMADDFDGDAGAVFLPAGEGAWLLDAGRGESVRLPLRSVLDRFEEQVGRTPEAAAVVHGGDVVSYAALDVRANRIAHRLRELGVGAESAVGVLLDRCTDLPAVLLGVWKAGGAYVPVDPKVPDERTRYALSDAAVSVLVTDSSLVESVAGAVDAPRLLLDRESEGIDALPGTAPARVTDLDQLAYVIYTSGSTGRPKGVQTTQRGLANYLDWSVAGYLSEGGGGAPLFSSVAFDVVVTTLYAPLITGRPLHILPADADLAELGELLRAQGPYDFIKLTPSHLDLLLPQLAGAGQDAGEGSVPLARTLIPGGDALSRESASRWSTLFGGARVINEYGPTEITVGNSFFPASEPFEGEILPIGRPIPGTSMYVLDGEMRLVPVGVTGEVCVGGECLARGYAGRPDVTADRFVPDPYGVPGARLYRTGDLARVLPDGNLEFRGRVDDQVKIRGFRVELGDIEVALAGQDGVREAVMVARENQTLVGYVVPQAGVTVDVAEVRARLGRVLPEYMVPSAIVVLDAMPLTANGKPDKRALPAPDDDAFTHAEFVAPRTPAEERIAEVWREVLGVERVGVHDSFFDLGGDSIRAVTLVGALRAQGIDVAVRDVFAQRTVEALGELVARRGELSEEAQRSVAPFELVDAETRAQLPDDVVDAYPLTQIQTGMVVEMLTDKGLNRYHSCAMHRVPDDRPFDEAALREALRIIASRQDVLRTSIDLTSYSVPMQLVHADVRIPLAVRDLRGLGDEEHRQTLNDFFEAERADVFDLAVAPLLRVTVLLEEDGWRLAFTQFHAITEGWGHHVFLMELLTTYGLLADGTFPAAHEAPAVRFADTVAGELASLASSEDRAYWTALVEDRTPVALPAGWGADDVPEQNLTLRVQLDDLEKPLRALASQAKASVKAVLLAAHLKVMSGLTEARHFHAGLVCDVRPEALGADRVYGMFLNTVPFPAERPIGRTWRELVERVHEQEVDLWAHRRFPLPEITRAVDAGQRLVNVVFNYQNYHVVDRSLIDVGMSAGGGATEFDLNVIAMAHGISLKTTTSVLSRANGERLVGMYRGVLEAMAADFDGDAGAAFLPAGERDWLLGVGRGDGVAGPLRSVLDRFEEQVRRTPDAVAVVHGGDVVSYAALDVRANRIAHRLRELGVGAESAVGVLLERCTDLPAVLLGVWKAGGAYVPVDPQAPDERTRYALGDAAVGVVVTVSSFVGLVSGAVDAPCLLLDRESGGLDAFPVTAPERVTDLDGLAYVIYTSGSTGRPKGVLTTQRGLANYVDWSVAGYLSEGGGGAPLFSSVAFDVVVTTLYAPLVTGRPLHILPAGADLGELGGLLRAQGPFDFIKLTPSHLDVLLPQLADMGEESVPLARTLIPGGDALSRESASRWSRLFGGARVINEYGPTEITVGNSFFPASEPFEGEILPIGRPIPGTSMYVLDGEMRLVPVGVTGEVCVGGECLARGYAGRPDVTADRFVPDPYGVPGARLYRTGDLARVLPDGNLEFRGRVDDQVKIRGFRVELGDIEVALAGQDGVREAVVVTREAASGDRSLVGYVVPEPEGIVHVAEVRAGLGRLLPEYMVPSAVVVLDAMPLTANGKPDKRALPAPDDDAFAHAEFVAPRTPAEERIAEVWREVLGVERVGVHDSFFDLGGDSIRAVTLVGALRAQGIDIGVQEIFLSRTVAALGELVGERGEVAAPEQRFTAPFELVDAETRAQLPDDVVDAYPLTQNQVGMLVESMSGDGRGSYHNVEAFHVRDERPFDFGVFEEAVRVVVARHEVLRSSVSLTDYAVPLQLVREGVDVPCGWRDVSGLGEEAVRAEVLSFVDAERADVFDLAGSGSLLRVFAHAGAADGWICTLTQHHAILEGWSFYALSMEIVECYRRLRDDAGSDAYEAPRVRFADAVVAEMRALESVEDREFWSGVVAGRERFVVPAGFGDPGMAEPAGPVESVRVRVELADVRERLLALAAAEDVPVKSVLLAAHVKVLAQLSQEEKFFTGLVGHCRPEVVGAERVYGMFLNTMPFPVDRTARTWRELVRQVFAREVEAWPHRHYPMPQVQRDAGRGGERLIDVLFNYIDFQQGAEPGPVSTVVSEGPNEFGLGVHARGCDHLALSTTSRVMTRSNAERLAAMYRAVLEAMATDPDGDARTIRLPAEERETIMGGSVVGSGVSSSGSVHELFEERVRLSPEAVAVIAGGVELSYGEVNERANRLAHVLRDAGVGAESLVGVCLERGADLLPSLLGVMKAGGGYVPLDPANPVERLRFMLADSGASVLVTTADLAGTVGFAGRVVVLDGADADVIAQAPAGDLAPVSEASNTAYVIYTSGSTGRPKGVVVPHSNVMRLLETTYEHFAFDESDVFSLFHSFAFDVSVFEMWGALLFGGSVVVIEREVARSPEDFLDLLVEREVTVLCQTPSAFRSLTAAAAAGDKRIRQLSLRAVVFAGEKLEVPELAPWVERLGLGRTALVNMFGPTETTVYVTYHRIVRRDLEPGSGNPIGRPLNDLRIHLLDPSGSLVPMGVPGEMHVAGPGVARGYLNRPGLTAERFVPDPFGGPGGRLYRTGDLAVRRPDGRLEFLGRIDDQVKIRGFRVELGEIEVALAAQESVREAVVVARENQKLVGYVVPRAGATVEVAAVRAGVGRVLPDYMVPSALVVLDALPLTPNGKLDKRALPAPDEDAFARAAFIAPRSPLEDRIAGVWRDVLGVERVGVQDSFFDLGGDSIRAVTLVGALRAHGIDIAVRDVLARRTVAGLAELADDRAPLADRTYRSVAPFELIDAETRAQLPDDVVDAYPLTQTQVGMLVESLAGDGRGSYHNVMAFHVRDERPFDFGVFEEAVRVVVARHEVLRSSVSLTDYAVPLQLVREGVDVPCGWRDVSGLGEEAVRAEVLSFVDAERADVFDLAACGSLLRVFAHAGAADGWICTLTQHHAILEGWSYHALLMEVVGCYRRLRDAGRLEEYEAPRVRFADAVAAEMRALESVEDREFWSGVVAGRWRFVLPTGFGGSGPVESMRVGVELAGVRDQLLALAAAEDVPVKSVLLAAHVKALAQLSQEEEFFTGLVGHCRPEVVGAERVYGMFLNTMPFPVDRTARTWRELVRQVFAREVEAWEHRHYPMPQVQRDAGGDGERLIDILFSYTDFHQVDSGVLTQAATSDPTEFALSVHALGSRQMALTTNTRVMTRANAERLAAMYRGVLEAMAADPDGDTGTVFLPPGERSWLVDTGRGEPVEAPLHLVLDRFEEQVRLTPKATAVVHGPEFVSYAELDARANRIAHRLRGLGVGCESVVGVLLERCVDLPVALLGVWKAGGAYVPVDPQAPEERIRYALADARVNALVTDSAHAGSVSGAVEGPCLLLDRESESADALPDSAPPRVTDPDLLAYVIYTSGSTGRPKGVQTTHRGLANYLRWAVAGYVGEGSGGAPLFSSVAFDVVVTTLFAPLVSGQPVHVLPADADLAQLGDLLRAQGPYDFIKLTPAHLDLLRPQLEHAAQDTGPLASTLIVGGDALSRANAERGRTLLGGARVINEYGPTEITVGNSVFPASESFEGEILPIGRPIPGTSMYVLDAKMRLVPVGVTGEVCVGGECLARGYAGRPELTAERFLPDPYGTPGARLYRTGDLARVLPDGNLEFRGRIDDQVKIRSFRVEPGEVEVALAGQDGVGEAVVVTCEAASGDPILVGYVVPLAGTTVDVAAIRTALGRELPEYMIPSAVVALEAMPLTANGKPDRRALPAPDEEAYARAEFVAPRTAAEERIAGAWREVLGLERVGVLDSFFDLGGDSIRVVTLVGALRAQGIDVGVQEIFRHRTVAALTELVDGRAALGDQAYRPVQPFELLDDEIRAQLPDDVVDAYPLTQNQTGMLVESLASGGRNYHLVNSARIRDDRPFSADALVQAVGALVARHEALRTSVDLEGHPVPIQRVHATADLPIGVVDLRPLDAREQELALRRFMRAESATPCSHDSAPMMRIAVHLCGDGSWQFTISQSHVILEGWSSHVLMAELMTLYRAHRDGTTPEPYEQAPIRFADAVAAELRALESEDDRAFWREVVTGRAKYELPPGWGSANDVPHESYSVRVPLRDLDARLRAFASGTEVPLKSVMLAAFLKAMGAFTSDTSFFVGLTTHVRPEAAGAERVYGMHLNTLPFPVDLNSPTWRDLVQQVFARETTAWPHRHYPMPAIQRELGDGRRLIDVYFSYQDFERFDGGLADQSASYGFSTNEFPFSVATGDGFLSLRSNTRAVSRENMERMAEVFRAVLASMADAPDGDALATALPAADRVLADRAHRLRDEPLPPRDLCSLIEEQAARTPHATAVIDGARVLSYAELDARAERLAGRLRSVGIAERPAEEAVVGVLLERSTELVVSLLAVWKAGAAYLPIDPSSPRPRVIGTLRDAGVSVVVTDDALRERLPDDLGDGVVIAGADVRDPAPAPAVVTDRVRDLDRTAYVIYTSGSTGRPKGVQVTHRGLLNHVRWAVDELAARGTGGAPLFSSVAFDLVVPNLWAPLVAGQPVTVFPGTLPLDELGSHLADAAPFSFVKLTPAHLELLSAQLTAEQANALASVVVVAGEALTRRVVDSWRKLAPQVELVNEYGPTETTVGACTFTLGDSSPADVVPIGHALPDVRMYVLDAWGERVPVGVPGELCVGGAGVARGYVERPGLTAERFLPDPYGVPGSRMYRTGDRVRMLADGAIDFLGRMDDQVKIRGYRVEPAEVRAALAAHEAVREAFVLVDEPALGERRLVAYVVPEQSDEAAEPTETELRAHCTAHLPEYMVPSAFVLLERLPLNPNGKIDRTALPDPDRQLPDTGREYLAPVGSTERALADIWSTVLGRDRISLDDNFFDLGGHSILVIHAVAMAHQAGLPLSLFLLYQHPTLGELAAALDASAPQPAHPPVVETATELVPGAAEALARGNVPGAAVAVLRGGELVAVETFGTATAGGSDAIRPDTLFPVGSMSKHVTSFAVLRMADEGALDLDADVNEYLSGWRIPGGSDEPPVTLRHLLGHMSGLSLLQSKGFPRGQEPATLLDLLQGRPPATNPPVTRELPPGSVFRKANANFSVVQQVLTDLTGEPFPDLMRTLVFDPLGMRDSSFDQYYPETSGRPVALGHTADGAPLADGWLVRPDMAAAGLWSTAVDMARLALAVRGSRLGRPLAPLSVRRAEEMLTPHRASSYGLGTVIDSTGSEVHFGHGGEAVGYRGLTLCGLHAGTGWVVLTNGPGGHHLIRALDTTDRRK
ncbi:non-ribosomal peptide synthase/polyketide synthase [Streptomyces sp. DSM 118878]